MELEDIILDGIEAIIPNYDDRGNCTELYTIDGKIHKIEKCYRTVLNQICEYYLVDLKAARKYFGEITFMKSLVPLSFDGEHVFVPIKVRKPIAKNDGAYGLVNTSYVEKVVEHNDEVIIKLYNNEDIKSLTSIKTTKDSIDRGNVVKREYCGNNPSITGKNNSKAKYSEPITLGDLVFLMEKTLESLN